VTIYTSPTQVRVLGEDEPFKNTIISGFELPLSELFEKEDESGVEQKPTKS
jgi:hypothetical protein